MPIYEYECTKCKTHVEILQKITDKPLTKCPKCKGRLEKQWSSTSFQLKGSGWYVTDYASKKAGAVGEEKKAESSEEKKTGAAEAAASGDKGATKEDKGAAKEDKGGTKEKESSPAKKSSETKNTSGTAKSSNARGD